MDCPENDWKAPSPSQLTDEIPPDKNWSNISSFGDKSVLSSKSENSGYCSSLISCPSTVLNEENITREDKLQLTAWRAFQDPVCCYRSFNEKEMKRHSDNSSVVNFKSRSCAEFDAGRVSDEGTYTCGECLYESKDFKGFLSHVRIHIWLKETREVQSKYPSPNPERKLYFLRSKPPCVKKFGDSETKQSTFKKFRCKLCPFSCDEACTLIRHQTVHAEKSENFRKADETSPNIFYCWHDNCSFLCDTLETFKLHKEFHDEKYQALLNLDQGEPKFCCQVCSFSCAKREHMNLHLEIHSKSSQNLRKDFKSIKKKFRCNICSFCCMKKLNLVRHMNTHLKISKVVPKATEPVAMKFKCPFVCAKKKYLVRDLNRHLRSAEDISEASEPSQTEFNCCICDGSFDQKKDLIFHEKRHAALSGEYEEMQNEEQNFKCKKCANTYTEKVYLDLHQHVHNEKFKCLFCGKGFKFRKAFKRHLEICKK